MHAQYTEIVSNHGFCQSNSDLSDKIQTFQRAKCVIKYIMRAKTFNDKKIRFNG